MAHYIVSEQQMVSAFSGVLRDTHELVLNGAIDMSDYIEFVTMLLGGEPMSNVLSTRAMVALKAKGEEDNG